MNALRHGLCGLLMLSACAIAAGPAGSAARRALSAAEARTLWLAARASDRPQAQPGEPAMWLSIPSLQFGLPALQEVTEDNLHRLPCVVAWPEAGMSLTVILGHRDTHFRPLEKLRRKAAIILTRRDGAVRKYHVTAIEVLDPETAQRKIRAHLDRDEVVLMTCHPFRYVGAAPNRILFWAARDP